MSEKVTYRTRAALSAGTPVGFVGTPAVVSPVESAWGTTHAFQGLSDNPGPWEVDIETSVASGTRRTLTLTSATLYGLISEINAQYPAEILARADGRRLCIYAAGASGSDSYLRVYAPVSGDTTFLDQLQIPYYPHPGATVYGDSLADTPFRNDTNNPAPTRAGTRFLRTGEEQSSQAINRALHALATNIDILREDAAYPLPTPIAVELNDSLSMHFVLDGDDFIEQISLGMIEGEVFHGAPLSGGSSLADLARFFAIVGKDGVPLTGWVDAGVTAGEVRRVSVALVTLGERQSARPTFSDTDAPDPLPLDTDGDTGNGYSALGVYWEKVAAADITRIEGDVLFCEDATFITAGVTTGDRLTISGSTQTRPHDNNGRWAVAEVLSETRVRVVPVKGGAYALLNDSTAYGSLGTVQVQHNGVYSTNLYITLYPPIRLPADGAYLLCCVPSSQVYPVEGNSGRIYLASDINARAGLDTDRGLQSVLSAGDGARVTQPIQLWSEQGNTGDAGGVGALVASGSGSFRTGWVLRADVGSSFLASYVGQIVQITGGLFLGRETFRILRYIDAAHIQLQPTASRLRDNVTGPISVTWRVHAPGAVDFPATMQVDVPARYGAGPTLQPAGGLLVVREQDDISGTGITLPGVHGITYLERVRRVGTTNILHLSGTFDGTDIVRISTTALAAADNIFPEASSSVRGTSSPLGGMFVRVLNGAMAGWYRLYEIDGADISLRHLDGSSASLVHDAAVTPILSIYRIALGGPTLLAGSVGASPTLAGLIVDMDGGETGAGMAIAAELRWRGEGRGIRIKGNDDTYNAHTTQRGSTGWAIEVDGYAPMQGIRVNLHAEDNTGLNDARRRVESGVYAAHSNVAWLDEVADVSDWRTRSQTTDAPRTGSALRAHQSGRDPAVVITRDYERDINDSPPYHTAAALSVIDIPTQTLHHDGHYTGSFFVGSIYQRSSFAEGSYSSGILTEDGMGAGRYLHPILPVYIDPQDTDWLYSSLGSRIDVPFAAPALGEPGQIWPLTTDGDGGGYSYALVPPDYTRFNVPHRGVVSIECPADDTSLALAIGLQTGRYIGLCARVLGAASGNGYYRITGVSIGDEGGIQTVYFAVDSEAGDALIATSLTPTAVRIHGERWFRFYGDVAAWMQLGTAHATDASTLPVLHTSLPANDAAHPHRTATLPTGLPENHYEAGGYADLSDLTGAAYGRPILQQRTLAEMSGVEVDPTGYSDGWQDAGEACSPFPDTGVIVKLGSDAAGGTVSGEGADGDLYGSVFNPDDVNTITSLRLADFSFERSSGTRAALVWSKRWGGCLCVTNDPTEITSSSSQTFRVVTRGVNALPEASFNLTVRYILALEGGTGERSETVVTRLVANNGSVLASESTEVTFSDNIPVDVSVVFSGADLHRAPDDKITTSVTGPLRVEMQVTDVLGGSGHNWYILQMSVQASARTIEHNTGARYFGSVAAADFRRLTPQTAVVPLHPHDAKLLDGLDYGKSFPDGWDHAQEGLPMVGLLARDSDSMPFEPYVDTSRILRHSPGKVSIIGQMIWNDPLAYVLCGTPDASAVVRFPGPTGFIIPLHVPHGALLTCIDLSLSFLPAVAPPNTATGGQTNFNVWHQIPLRRTDNESDWIIKETWDNVEGVKVKLWRAASWERGTPDTPTGDFPGATASPFGYPEVLYTKVIDLAAVVEPEGNANNQVTTEHAVLARLLLTDTTGLRLRDVLVDTRAYFYFVTVEFWTGMRVVNTGATDTYGLCTSEANTDLSQNDVRGRTLYGRTFFGPHDYSLGTFGSKASFPPRVTFRGGKVTYRTDRVG